MRSGSGLQSDPTSAQGSFSLDKRGRSVALLFHHSPAPKLFVTRCLLLGCHLLFCFEGTRVLKEGEQQQEEEGNPQATGGSADGPYHSPGTPSPTPSQGTAERSMLSERETRRGF